MLLVLVVIGSMFVGIIVRDHGISNGSVKYAVLGSVMILGPAIACSVFAAFSGSYWWAIFGGLLVIWNALEFIKFYRTETRK